MSVWAISYNFFVLLSKFLPIFGQFYVIFGLFCHIWAILCQFRPILCNFWSLLFNFWLFWSFLVNFNILLNQFGSFFHDAIWPKLSVNSAWLIVFCFFCNYTCPKINSWVTLGKQDKPNNFIWLIKMHLKRYQECFCLHKADFNRVFFRASNSLKKYVETPRLFPWKSSVCVQSPTCMKVTLCVCIIIRIKHTLHD